MPCGTVAPAHQTRWALPPRWFTRSKQAAHALMDVHVIQELPRSVVIPHPHALYAAAGAVPSMTAKAPQPAAYRLIASDELGVLRVLEVPAGPTWSSTDLVHKWGQLDKQQHVHRLCSTSAGLEPGAASLVAAARPGALVQLLDGASGEEVGSYRALPQQQLDALGRSEAAGLKVTGLTFLTPGSSPAAVLGDRLLSVTSTGVVAIASCSDSSSSGAGNREAGAAAAATAAAAGGGAWSIVSHFQSAPAVDCMAVDASCSYLVVGAEGHQPTTWDLTTGQKTWQAKGGKPNALRLVDKPHITALAYLNSNLDSSGIDGGGSSSQGAGGGGEGGVRQRFVAGTGGSKLLLYDSAAGKRPQAEVAWGGTRVTCLSPEPDGNRVWASNGLGQVEVWDLRAGKLQGAIKGAGGSIRALQLHPHHPLLASAGIDRFVRVHSSQTRQQLARVYLKQQLTGLCWLPPVPVAAAVAGNEAAAAAAGGADSPEHDQQPTEGATAGPRPAGSGRRAREAKSEGVAKKSKKHRKQ